MHLWKQDSHAIPRGPLLVVDYDGTMAPGSAHEKLVEYLVKAGVLPDLGDICPEFAEARSSRRAHDPVYVTEWIRAIRLAYVQAQMTRTGLSAHAHVYLANIYADQHVFSRALFETAREAGYVLVMITHGPLEIMHLLAQKWGFHYAIANDLDVDHTGAYTGRERRFPIKDRDLQDLVVQEKLSLDGAVAMGDTMSDLPMLRLATYPIVINPDPVLRAHLDRDLDDGSYVARVTEVNGVVAASKRFAAVRQPTSVTEVPLGSILPRVLVDGVRSRLTAQGVYLL